jgi:protein SCO1
MDAEPRTALRGTPKRAVPGWLRSRRTWAAAGLVILAAAAAGAGIWARMRAPALQGAIVTPPAPTYDFQLRDQHNQVIQLSALRGKAVALTFLYANCPDVCPLIANKMHEAYQQLGAAAPRVALLAVSVDPNGDTPQAVQRFLTTHGVDRELHYLAGSFAELRPVWGHYYIGSDAKEVNPQAAAASAVAPGSVDHTAIVYVLDPRGNLRVFLPGNFDPKDLATDLKILALEAR